MGGVNIEAKTNDDETGFIWACANGYVEIAKLLIQNGVNIEAKNKYARTGFICACEEGHVEMVNFLIQNGVNIEAKTNDDWTGLDLAEMYSKKEIIQMCKDMKQFKVSKSESAKHTCTTWFMRLFRVQIALVYADVFVGHPTFQSLYVEVPEFVKLS